MTKYKCDVCGEKHDRIHIIIECSNCYLRGWKKELKKQKGDYWEVDAKEKIQNAQRRIKEVINMEWSKGMEYILSEVKEIFEEELKKQKGDGE